MERYQIKQCRRHGKEAESDEDDGDDRVADVSRVTTQNRYQVSAVHDLTLPSMDREASEDYLAGIHPARNFYIK